MSAIQSSPAYSTNYPPIPKENATPPVRSSTNALHPHQNTPGNEQWIQVEVVDNQSLNSTTASAAPTDLPGAPELKEKIATLLTACGKSKSKAQAIALRIPTDDPLKLNNIYGNLNNIKNHEAVIDDMYALHKDIMSWENKNTAWYPIAAITIIGIVIVIGHAIVACACRDATTDKRITLRALMLYTLSSTDPLLLERNAQSYRSAIVTAHNICSPIKDELVYTLEMRLSSAQETIAAEIENLRPLEESQVEVSKHSVQCVLNKIEEKKCYIDVVPKIIEVMNEIA